MAVAGHTSKVKLSGTAVPVTNEACALLSGSDPNEVYQVTNTARRIWDPTVPVTVKDNAVTVNAADYTFDYLFGIIRFSVAATGPITVDGSYLPVHSLAEVMKYDFKVMGAQLEKTAFDQGADAGWKKFLQGLKELEATFEGYDSLLSDVDPVAGGVQSLLSVLLNDTPKLLEIERGGQFVRGWFRGENVTDSGEVAGILKITVALRGSAVGPGAAFGIGT